MKLWSAPRSSTSYRIRIALALKDIDYERQDIDLVAGEQTEPAFFTVNPAGRVPVWQDETGILTQSMAILWYLEQRWPHPPLLQGTLFEKAQQWAFAQAIACDIHPLNNLNTLTYLTQSLGMTEDQKQAWYHHWIHKTFQVLEQQVGEGPFCFGESLSVADVCLVPQVYNARRYGVDLAPYPQLCAIDARCCALEAFQRAAPKT